MFCVGFVEEDIAWVGVILSSGRSWCNNFTLFGFCFLVWYVVYSFVERDVKGVFVVVGGCFFVLLVVVWFFFFLVVLLCFVSIIKPRIEPQK